MPIISKGTIKIGNLEVKSFTFDISYAPFTEYGKPFIDSDPNVIDSTAIVIDSEVKVLPSPVQKDGE